MSNERTSNRGAAGPPVMLQDAMNDSNAHYWDMMLKDHGFIRTVRFNFHAITEGKMYRSAQPSPKHIARFKERGIKTVINLRGARDCGSYHLEEKACREHGIALENFPVSSRDMPKVEWINGAKELFDRIEYPAVLHCKSGADRAGLMSVLYAFVHEGRPLEEAMEQLAFKYGHMRQAKTGLIDWFFNAYRKRNEEDPIDFFEWVNGEYTEQRLELKDQFMAKGWAVILVDIILRRE